MATPIDNAVLPTPAGAPGAAGKSASASGRQNPAGALGDGLQNLFAALLDLAAGQGGNAQTATSGGGTPISTETALSRTAGIASNLHLGGLIDIKALLANIANAAKDKAGAAAPGDKAVDPATAALTDLIDRLENALGKLKPGGPDDPAATDLADKAIAAFGDALAAIENRFAAAAPSSQSAADPAPPLGADRRSALIDQLRAAATALRQFAAGNAPPAPQPSPTASADIGTGINGLLQRLDALIAGDPHADATGAKPATSARPTTEAVVATLLGKTDADPAAGKTLQVHVLTGGDNAQSGGAGTTTGADPDPLLTAPPKPSADTGKPATGHAKPNGAGTVAAAAAGPPQTASDNTTSKSTSSDTILALQAQPAAARADALRPMTAAYQSPQPALNVPNIAFEMVRQFTQGNSRFQIRLDPPEMGKIDVTMNVDKSGSVHAHLAVERAETLDLLQRDARGLERALQQSGLDGAKTSLEFSLKQNPFARQDSGQGGQHGFANLFTDGAGSASTAADATTPPVVRLYRGSASPGGVNMFV